MAPDLRQNLIEDRLRDSECLRHKNGGFAAYRCARDACGRHVPRGPRRVRDGPRTRHIMCGDTSSHRATGSVSRRRQREPNHLGAHEVRGIDEIVTRGECPRSHDSGRLPGQRSRFAHRKGSGHAREIVSGGSRRADHHLCSRRPTSTVGRAAAATWSRRVSHRGHGQFQSYCRGPRPRHCLLPGWPAWISLRLRGRSRSFLQSKKPPMFRARGHGPVVLKVPGSTMGVELIEYQTVLIASQCRRGFRTPARRI